MTHTEAATRESDEVASHEPSHHDPLHDIDGPKTTYAVVGSLVVIVGLIWGMSHLYNIIVQVERQAKIGDIEPKELNRIRAEEHAELNGENPDRGSMTIEDAITEYLKK